MGKRRAVAAVGAVLLALGVWLLWFRGPGGTSGVAGTHAPRGNEGASDKPVAGARDRAGGPALARGAIEGTVRDPAGAPIAGAHVCGNASSDELATDDIREPICASTGPDGRYRLADLLPAAYRIDASAPRFRPAQHRDRAHGRDELRLAPGEVRREVDLVLQPGGIEVVGVVNDVGGGPIAGAWVQASSRRAGAASLTRTAADGSFRLWFVPGPLVLVALADGYVEGQRIAVAPGQEIEVLLTPESILAGRVVEVRSGAPVAGARVGLGDLATAISDEDGRFRLTHLLPGRYKPYATSPAGVGKADESVLVGLGQTVEGVTIELHPAVPVTGRVVVAGTGAPCAEGTLFISQAATGRSRVAPIVDGRTQMDGVLPGTYGVRIECSGFLPNAQQPDLVVDLAVPPAEQRWNVESGVRIRGVVLGADGAPVAGAQVTANPVGGDSAAGMGGGDRSDTDGRFEIDGLRGGPYEVVAQAPDRPAGGPIKVTVIGPDEGTVEIRLPSGGELVGEVVDEAGRPVSGAVVIARGGAAPAWVDPVQTQTLDDGRFSMNGLAPDRYEIRVDREGPGGGMPPDGPGGAGPSATATITSGATARVRIVVPTHDGVIRGRVVDGEGAPITDAFVDAQAGDGAREQLRSGWHRRPALTDPTGAFALEKLPPGTYTVRAYRRGGGEALMDGVAVGKSITLAIRPTGSIAGSVRTDAGAIPERVTVMVRERKTDFERSENFFRTGGRYAIKDLPPGAFEVSAEALEGTATAEAQVGPGQAVTGVDLVLAGRVTVTGRLVSADDGSPLAGHAVRFEIVAGDRASESQTSSGADGRFQIENVPVGKAILTTVPDAPGVAYAPSSHGVVVRPGPTSDVGDLRVPRAAPATGR